MNGMYDQVFGLKVEGWSCTDDDDCKYSRANPRKPRPSQKLSQSFLVPFFKTREQRGERKILRMVLPKQANLESRMPTVRVYCSYNIIHNPHVY